MKKSVSHQNIERRFIPNYMMRDSGTTLAVRFSNIGVSASFLFIVDGFVGAVFKKWSALLTIWNHSKRHFLSIQQSDLALLHRAVAGVQHLLLWLF
jgi:hypothetical protein